MALSVCQRFIRNVVYPLNLWWDGEWAEMHYLCGYERSQYLSADSLQELRLRYLRQLLDHAYRNCPYYRTKWSAAGVVPSDVRKLEDLGAIPVLSKADIQQHRDQIVAQNWPKDDLIANQTGGSTGTPISFFLSRDRIMLRNAAMWRHNRWADYDVGDKVAMVWGALRHPCQFLETSSPQPAPRSRALA